MAATNDPELVIPAAFAAKERATGGAFRARPAVVAAALLLLTSFFLWFLSDWITSFALIHAGARRGQYIAWTLLQVMSVVTFGGGFLTFWKARLRWSRILFCSLLVGASALLQGAAAVVYTGAMADPAEDRLLWLGEWMTPRVLTCMWSACAMTGAAAVLLGGLAWCTPRDGTIADFKLVVNNWRRSLMISPWRLAFGPIFVKEIRVSGRRPGTYWMRGLYVGALVGLISLLYFAITVGEAQHLGTGAQRLEKLQTVAPDLAVAIAWFQYMLLLLLAAALTAPSICDERRTRTLSALMTTPMSSAQIVFGKLCSRLVLLFILALISVPFLLGARIFGGLDAESVFAMTAVSLTSALFMASLGTLFSIWSRKSGAAAVTAIFTYLLIEIGPVLVLALLLVRGRAGRGGPPEEIILLSSPVTLMAITSQISGGGGPNLPVRLMWMVNSGMNVLFAAITLFIASGALRRVMLADPAPAAARPAKKRRRRVTAAATPAGVPAASGGAAPLADGSDPSSVPADPVSEVYVQRDREVWNQPVLWREMRQPAVGSRRNLIVSAVVVALASLWLYAEIPPRDDDAYPIVAVIALLITCFAASISTTASVSGEKEASTWQVLLCTPLRPVEILGAKMLGAIRRHWFAAAVLAIHMCIGIVFAGMHPIVLLHLGMIVTAAATLLAGTGLLFSLVVQRPLAAMLLNLLFAGLLWCGVPIMGMMIAEYAFRGSGDEVADVVMSINPVFMGFVATDAAAGSGRRGLDYRLPGARLDWFEFTAVLGLVCGLAVACGLTSLFAACRVFKRRSGRAS